MDQVNLVTGDGHDLVRILLYPGVRYRMYEFDMSERDAWAHLLAWYASIRPEMLRVAQRLWPEVKDLSAFPLPVRQ